MNADEYWNATYAADERFDGWPRDLIARFRIACNDAYGQHPEIWEFFQNRMERVLAMDTFDTISYYAEGTLTGIRDLKYLHTLRNR